MTVEINAFSEKDQNIQSPRCMINILSLQRKNERERERERESKIIIIWSLLFVSIISHKRTRLGHLVEYKGTNKTVNRITLNNDNHWWNGQQKKVSKRENGW